MSGVHKIQSGIRNDPSSGALFELFFFLLKCEKDERAGINNEDAAAAAAKCNLYIISWLPSHPANSSTRNSCAGRHHKATIEFQSELGPLPPPNSLILTAPGLAARRTRDTAGLCQPGSGRGVPLPGIL